MDTGAWDGRVDVQVVRGPLVGARGHLVRVASGRHKLVIAVEFVNQAVAVEIDAADVVHAD
jgi:transcription antitermination factor NusG